MDNAINFQLQPTPICHETILAKSIPTTEILWKVNSLLNPQPELVALTRLPGIFGFTCKSNGLKTFGKGFSADQAKVSALMEHWERCHWLKYPFMTQNGYRVASFADLFRQKTALVPAAYFLMNLTDPNRWSSYLPQVGEIPLHWLPAWSFSRNESILYPVNWHNICYTSNGLAAGSTLSEALLQGVCEVVERENIWRWLAEGAPAPIVDPNSIQDEACQQLLTEAAKIGVKLIIRDTSLTCDIPCYSVYGQYNCRDGQKWHFSAAGHGCHPSPLLALKRALSEYLASHYICQAASGDEPGIWSGELPAMPPLATLKNQDAILAGPTTTIPLANSSKYETDDLTTSFNFICEALTQDGYEVTARLLNPGEPLPVVRVIIPCMRALFGTEIKEYPMILAQAAYEGGLSHQSMDFILHSLEQPGSSIQQLIGQNPMMQMLLPSILRQMGPQLFFGKTYQESFDKFDKLSQPTGNLGQILGSLFS